MEIDCGVISPECSAAPTGLVIVVWCRWKKQPGKNIHVHQDEGAAGAVVVEREKIGSARYADIAFCLYEGPKQGVPVGLHDVVELCPLHGVAELCEDVAAGILGILKDRRIDNPVYERLHGIVQHATIHYANGPVIVEQIE